jgi:hypothetical protein
MSSLTCMLAVETYGPKLASGGQFKVPLYLEVPVPAEYEVACISLLSGQFRFVRVDESRPMRTGFFPLPRERVSLNLEPEEVEGVEDSIPLPSPDVVPGREDQVHAILVDYLYTHARKRGWANVSTCSHLSDTFVGEVASYFKAYDLTLKHFFVGMVGWYALYEAGQLELPEDIPIDTVTHEVLTGWMVRFFHVGTVCGVPVHYNEFLTLDLVAAADPTALGYIYRTTDQSCVVLHNAERALVSVRFQLEGVSPWASFSVEEES